LTWQNSTGLSLTWLNRKGLSRFDTPANRSARFNHRFAIDRDRAGNGCGEAVAGARLGRIKRTIQLHR
jgi:hypothetical protein